MQAEITRCSWNFGFKLIFADKQYELYAATKKDRDQWIKVLGTLAEMNRQNVQLENPFDYLKGQEKQAKKMIEEEKMSESARGQK